MTEPTKKQVLEWVAQIAKESGFAHDPADWDDLDEKDNKVVVRLCALAFAAGVEKGAREENEEAARVCDLEHAACWHADAISQAKEAKRCADAIRARRPA